MNLFDISSILLTISALGSCINYKWMKLPSSIGLLLIAIMLGLIGILFKKIGLINYSIDQFLSNIDFQDTIITRELFEKNLHLKLKEHSFVDDISQLLSPELIQSHSSPLLNENNNFLLTENGNRLLTEGWNLIDAAEEIKSKILVLLN